MQIVSKIDWVSPTAEEAEVTVSGGEFSCAAFCQPCRYREGDQVADPLHIFGLKTAMLSEVSAPYLEKATSSGLGQRGVGHIVDLAHAEIAIGDLRLVFDDPIPGGLSLGDMIAFECARIDLW